LILDKKEPEISPIGIPKRTPQGIVNKNISSEHRKSMDNTRVINANKGIGIHEQNIFQIICKSPDYFKDNNPYLIDLYKHRLEEKNKEVFSF